MREKIAEIEFEHMLDARFPSHEGIPYKDIPDNFPQKSLAYRQAKEIIELIYSEIEKVENPYKSNTYSYGTESRTWDKCCQKILSLLRPKEDVGTAEGAKSG